jgi:conjugative transposon TraK protein
MFKQFRNIDTAFKHIRLFSFVLIIAYTLLCCFVVYKCTSAISTTQSKVYVIANGKLLPAAATERASYLDVEVRDHVKMFHFYFYSLSPDEQAIQRNVTKSLYLCDNSAKNEYDNMKESGYYSGIISANISQEIECDSVRVNMDATPIQFTYYGTIKIIRSTSVLTRSIITTGFIRLTSPSDNNPHGMLVEKWKVLENKDINLQKR